MSIYTRALAERRRWMVKRAEIRARAPRFVYTVWLRMPADWVQVASGYLSAAAARAEALRWIGPEYREGGKP